MIHSTQPRRVSLFTWLKVCCVFAFVLILRTSVPLSVSAQNSELQVSQSTPAATTAPLPPTNPLSLTLSPISLLIETDPETPVSSSFQILNNSSETENLKISLMTFTADQAGDSPVIREFSVDEIHKDWLSFSPSSFSVAANTWKTVQVTFSPPKEAALSYYYAIVITRQTAPTVPVGETAVVGAPALLALTTVRSPLAKQELQLKSFRATKRVFEFLPVSFELEVKNTGNIHLAPIGNIFVNSGNKKDIGQLQINRTNGLILPGTTRTYTLSWAEGFPLFTPLQKDGAIVTDEQGKPKMKLDWDFAKANLFRFGKFTGHLIFIYDDGQRDIPTEALVEFFVIPWRILLVIGVLASLILLGASAPLVWLLRRMRSRKKKHEAE